MDQKNETKMNMTSNSTETKTSGGIGNLIKLLPTGTVFVFQFLNPVFTNSGQCKTSHKYLSSIFLVLCGFSCFFSTFTDSYTGTDKKRHNGIVTPKGLWPSEASDSIDLSKYKLKGQDFIHATLSLIIFALLGLLDTNTVLCFYPSFESTQKQLLQVLPPTIGVIVSSVFMVFPQHRHGIGYPVSNDSNDVSIISNDTIESPQNNV